MPSTNAQFTVDESHMILDYIKQNIDKLYSIKSQNQIWKDIVFLLTVRSILNYIASIIKFYYYITFELGQNNYFQILNISRKTLSG